MEDDITSYDDKPITPLRCPRCGKKVIFKKDDTIECEDCGVLYYDPWLGIYRIQRTEDEED